jgi:predicted AAA+ superfamily ATPase
MDILTRIFDLNPWFKESHFLFPEKDLPRRTIFEEIETVLDSNFIISLSGLRRTGKTTLLKQIINQLLLRKIPAELILYFEFDELNNNLEEVLEFYFRNILRKDLYNTGCYIFLDELQNVDYWQVVLKRYYDINSKIQFIVTGSSNLHNNPKVKESLTGRILNFNIFTLSFPEYLFFKYGKKYSLSPYIMQNDFLTRVKNSSEMLIYKNELNEYLSFGEFPQYFKNNDSKLLTQYYKDSILQNIFTKDINLFKINNIKSFYEYFRILSKSSAQEINLSNISRDIQVSSSTIKRYQDIIETMFLADFLYKYEKSYAKQAKSFKKVYIKSINLIKAQMGFYFESIEKDFYGHLIETFVYNELSRNKEYKIYYYNNTRTKKEVDFILIKDDKVLPVEVKTNTIIPKSRLSNLLGFMKDNKLKKGVVFYGGNNIYSESFDDGISIEYIPYFFI